MVSNRFTVQPRFIIMAERIVYLASTTFFCFVVSKMSLRTILLHAGKLIQVFLLFYTVSPVVDAYSVRRQITAKMAMLYIIILLLHS